jgi:hypothetical protein
VSTQAIAAATTEMRDLILGARLPIPLADSLLQAATRLEAAADDRTQCPKCAGDEQAVAALRAVIGTELRHGTCTCHNEKAEIIARAIVAAGLAKDGAR